MNINVTFKPQTYYSGVDLSGVHGVIINRTADVVESAEMLSDMTFDIQLASGDIVNCHSSFLFFDVKQTV